MQGWCNMKSVLYTLEQRTKFTVVSVDAVKVFDKIQHLFHDNTQQNGIRRELPQSNKGPLKNPHLHYI